MSKVQYIPCLFCKSTVEINIDWAIRNGRVFCGSCCKSFDIRVGEEEDETPEPPKKDVPVEKVEDTKEKFDKAVEEHFESITDTNDDYWDTF